MIVYYITIIAVFITSSIAENAITYQKENGQYFQIKNRKYSFFAIITACILIFVAGLRYRVGADYGNYISLYEVRKETWLTYLKSFDEPGISVLCKICSMIYDSSATLFFVCALITVGLYMYNIKKYSTQYCFSVLMFIFCGTWAGTFGAIRQYLAAAIMFAGHRYMLERKIWKWVLIVFVAYCFHRTAIIMLPVYFIANKKINFKTIAVLLVSALIIINSYDVIFSFMSDVKGSDQTQYSYMNTEVNIFRVLVAIAPIALYIIMNSVYKIERSKETEFYGMLLFVNAIFMLGTMNSAYLARAGIYTETYVVFGFSKMFEKLEYSSRRNIELIILLLFCLYFMYQINYSSVLNNFQWIFGHL